MPEATSAASYRVEVSGWDSQDTFFVEKTTLEWSEVTGKRIFLRSMVPNGAVVFVRLLDPTGRQAIPVAYHVAGVCRADGRGAYEIALEQVRPNGKARPPAGTLIGNIPRDED